MSVVKTATATCDVCKADEKLDSWQSLPPNWERVTLRQQLTENSRQLHTLDLCPKCQLEALRGLGVLK